LLLRKISIAEFNFSITVFQSAAILFAYPTASLPYLFVDPYAAPVSSAHCAKICILLGFSHLAFAASLFVHSLCGLWV